MVRMFVDADLLNMVLWNNSLARYIDVVIFLVISLIILYILQKIVFKKLSVFVKHTKTEIDDVVVEFIRSIKPQLYVVLSFYAAIHALSLSDDVIDVLNVVVIMVIIFQVTRSLQVIVEFLARRMSAGENDEHTKSAAHLLGALFTVIIWIFGILMILSNIGVDVSSLIAGVGIGGIAIAFAVKEVLSDLFSSFAIYFDKPFKAGDIIKINNDTGEVKKIGIKTTRIKSITGEEIIVSNQELTSSRVHNYKKLTHRTITFHFSISYDTSTDLLRKVPVVIKDLIDRINDVHCKRVHFKAFGEYALEFEVVYVVDNRKYSTYMDRQQEINIGVMELFKKMNISLVHHGKFQ